MSHKQCLWLFLYAHILNTTYAQHGLVNIAKKKRGVKSFQNQLFEEILAHVYTIG
mgnify:CR=1 FL=1